VALFGSQVAIGAMAYEGAVMGATAWGIAMAISNDPAAVKEKERDNDAARIRGDIMELEKALDTPVVVVAEPGGA
jgi:sugar phosphate isomerase/epimerase